MMADSLANLDPMVKSGRLAIEVKKKQGWERHYMLKLTSFCNFSISN
jgi:hypothetical protein